MTPTQEDAELADFILGRSARLVDLDRITAFRLAAEERGKRVALEAAAKVAESDDLIASDSRKVGSFGRTRKDHGELIATAIRQIDPASLGAE